MLLILFKKINRRLKTSILSFLSNSRGRSETRQFKTSEANQKWFKKKCTIYIFNAHHVQIFCIVSYSIFGAITDNSLNKN